MRFSVKRVVAEDAVFREAPVEGALERVDVVDPLADVRALTEEVLIDIRYRARIGVDARLPAKQARVARGATRGEAHHDTRL